MNSMFKPTALFIFTIIIASQMIYGNCQFRGETFKFKLSAINLPSGDFDGMSDPIAVVFTSIKVGRQRQWEQLGQTSVKSNTVNPQWDEVFTYKYVEGANQLMRIFINDKDLRWSTRFDDLLGRVDVRVDDYLREVQKAKVNGTYKPIELFLTQPLGGIVLVTPVD